MIIALKHHDERHAPYKPSVLRGCLLGVFLGAAVLYTGIHVQTFSSFLLAEVESRHLALFAPVDSATAIQASVCPSTQEAIDQKKGYEWTHLCRANFVQVLHQALLEHPTESQQILQIGAHVGLEDQNDPLARGMLAYLKHLSPSQQQQVHWTFVEPAPTNFRRLQTNLRDHQQHRTAPCRMSAIPKAVVSDALSLGERNQLDFYSIRDTIDPTTGYDSLSGKSFPPWITQLSGFSIHPINFNGGVWNRRRVKLEDYIVKSKVDVTTYTDLVAGMVVNTTNRRQQRPMLVLVDTEGLDCDILLGIATDSPYWPRYLIFEHHQCPPPQLVNTQHHLHKVGYRLLDTPVKSQNAVAVLSE